MKIYSWISHAGRAAFTGKFGTLLKFRLRYTFGIKRLTSAAARLSSDKAPFMRAAVIGILLFAVIVLLIFVPYVVILTEMCRAYTAEIYFNTVLTLGNFAVFAVSLLSAYGLFSSGKERELLTPFPIPKGYIFAVQYITFYISAFITSFLCIVTGVTVYAVCAGDALSAYAICMLIFKALIGVILFPALPCAAAFVIISAVFLISGLFRHKELIATVLGFAAVILLIVIKMSPAPADVPGGIFADITGHIGKILFNAFFLCSAFTGEASGAWLYIVFAAASSVFLSAAIYLYGSALYDRILQKMNASYMHRGDPHNKYRQKSASRAFCVKELKILIRSPIYALNCLLNIVIAPVAAIVVSKNIVGVLTDSGMFENKSFEIAGLFICLIIMSMGMAASTSVSREGKSFSICRFIPVRLSEQVKGRAAAAVILYILCGMLFIIPYVILLKINFLYIIYGFFIVLAASVSFACSGLLIDLAHPKLIWNKEAEAVKQNFNAVAGMLVSVLLSVIIMLPLIVYLNGNINKTAMLAAVMAIAVLAACAGILLMRRKIRLMEGITE